MEIEVTVTSLLCACVCEIFLLMTLLYITVNMIDYDLLIIMSGKVTFKSNALQYFVTP